MTTRSIRGLFPRDLRGEDAVGFGTLLAIAVVAVARSAQCQRATAKQTRGEVARWYRDTSNEFIATAYRRTDLTWCGIVASLFKFHNEFVNVWTHLVSSIVCICQAVHVLRCAANTTEGLFRDELNFLAFFTTCSAIMFTLSWMFHLFAPYSARAMVTLNRTDYVGIIVMIVGSFYPMVRVVFPSFDAAAPLDTAAQAENARIRWWYLSGITALGVPLTLCAMQKFFYLPSFQLARAVFFICFGGLGAVPFFHGYARDQQWMDYHTSILVMGALYIVGALLYAFHVPERFVALGTFDLFGASHQLFHLCICAAACVHWNGCRNGLERLHGLPLSGFFGPAL